MTTDKPNVQRYTDMGSETICPINNLRKSDDGSYVLYEDYEALQTMYEKLRKHLQNLIDQTTPLVPEPGNPMWSRRIQLDEVTAERDQLRAECEKLHKDTDKYRPLLETVQGEPVAWLPYLTDRADGVTGHYAIARKNPAGYREMWNLRSHRWAAFSDEVLTLDEALAILKKLEMPTAPQPSFQLPEFATDPDDSDEGASLWDHGYKTGWNACLEVATKTVQPAEQPVSWIRISGDRVILSRCDWIYPASTEDSAGPRDEQRFTAVGRRDGDIVLLAPEGSLDREDMETMLAWPSASKSVEQKPDVTQLVEALKQILGWRELRSGQEFPIDRIEDIARNALAAYLDQGGEL